MYRVRLTPKIYLVVKNDFVKLLLLAIELHISKPQVV